MEEKPIGTQQEEHVEEKKAYTPPALTVYGKLTELTAGGSGTTTEAHQGGIDNSPKKQRS